MRRLAQALVCAVALVAGNAAWAVDLVWDGKTYLDIGLQLGADTMLVFPESVEISAENIGAFEQAESATDSRMMSIRPKVAQEQRVTFIGTKSKTVYLARFSTRSPYAPIYKIKDATVVEAAKAAVASQMSPTGFMRLMMAGTPGGGVSVKKLQQDLVAGDEYRIDAHEVWESPTMTGIIAKAKLQPGVGKSTIRPSDVSLRIPAFGQTRMMGADRWDMDKEAGVTTVYFIFTR